MKISFNDKENVLYVEKDDSDTRMSKESTFYYHLAKKLSAMKFHGEQHFFRKEMAKDGHWVDPHVFYVTNKKRTIRAYDGFYATRNVAESFNKGEVIDLYLDVFPV